MHILLHEFILTLRRLFRRRAQNGLLFLTLAISVTLSLLSWSLFYTVHLSHPAFDPDGDYYVLGHAGETSTSAHQCSVDELAAYQSASGTLFADFVPVVFYESQFIQTPYGQERVMVAHLSARALQLTGAKPQIGALFQPADDAYRAPGKALLSARFWRDSYGSDPDILGKVIELSGYPVTIVGVMPLDYRFPNDQDLWLSMGSASDEVNYPARAALVKLKPGVTRERVERDLRAIQSNLPPDTTALKKGWLPSLTPYREFYLLPDLRVSSMILFALSLLFVAVSCANAANLMIIDFLGRRSELGYNLALGIPRVAAIRGLCWQVGVIALASAGVAITVLPFAGPLLFDRIRVINAPWWLAYDFSWRDVGVALLLAGISAVVTLIAPVIYSLLVDPEKVIREHASATRGTGRSWWRRVLLTGQIALLTVLGICAGLLLRSSRNVSSAHWGYAADRVFMGKIANYSIHFTEEEKDQGRLATHEKVVNELRQQSATAAAAFADNAPGYSNGPYCTYSTDPAALTKGRGAVGEAFFSQISNQYFQTLDVPVIAGQDFLPETPPDGLPVCVINESLARKLWGNENPLHRTFYVHYPWLKENEPPVKLVVRGVVRDFQANGPRARSNDAIFTPYTTKWGANGSVFLFVRDQDGRPTFRAINDAIHQADERVALYFSSTIKGQIELMLNSVRMTTDLTSIFAFAAVLLCAIGVYSLTVTQVLQSAREFGIRMALGAEPQQLWQTFARGYLLNALIGVVIGLIGVSQLVRVLGSLLYGVNAHDLPTYAGVALAILLVAALACLPSLRQLRRINPADCLRSL